jgi:WS/DGAT/MGAT family acyltransferase
VSITLSGADTFWLRMDHPTNLMMVSGVMLFDAPVDPSRVREVLARRVAPLPRFRARVVRGARGRPSWEPDPAFDLDRHVVRETLPAGSGEAGLCELVSRTMSEPLDAGHPLWRLHVVEGGAPAIVARFHHCLGDGVGLLMVMLALTDTGPDEPAAARDNPFVELLRGESGGFDEAWKRVEEIMPEGAALMRRPAEILASSGLARRSAATAAALARIALLRPDPTTALNARPLSIGKRAAWSRSIPLAEIRETSHAAGGTVNDVLLAAMTGALRRWLLEREGEAGCKDFRAAVPVSLRPVQKLAAMGNEFGLVFLSLPVAAASWSERLAEVRRRMVALKRSADAPATLATMRLAGRLPRDVQRLVVRLFATKATAVMTNVPGPNRVLYLAGRPIRDVLFWVPRAAGLSIGVSILSYAGGVRLGVAADSGVVPDPERIVEAFHAELDEVRALSLRA